jgi:hypothetical protein
MSRNSDWSSAWTLIQEPAYTPRLGDVDLPTETFSHMHDVDFNCSAYACCSCRWSGVLEPEVSEQSG